MVAFLPENKKSGRYDRFLYRNGRSAALLTKRNFDLKPTLRRKTFPKTKG